MGVCQNFSARGFWGGTGPLNVNLGPPDISETTTDRKLNLNIDMVKYPHWVQKNIILYDTTWGQPLYWFSTNVYIRDRLRLTTARRLSAYMSSRALATTTASSLYYFFLHEYAIFSQILYLYFTLRINFSILLYERAKRCCVVYRLSYLARIRHRYAVACRIILQWPEFGLCAVWLDCILLTNLKSLKKYILLKLIINISYK